MPAATVDETIPDDWRDRLEAILAADGLTQPVDESPWALRLKLLGRLVRLLCVYAVCAMLIMTVVVFAPSVLLRLGFPSPIVVVAVVLVFVMLFVGQPVALITYLWPRAQNLSRQFAMAGRGLNATRAVRGAREPPVLFLRSFKFDSESSRPPFWSQLLLTLAAGGAGARTPEMSLVLAVPSGTPVLAIGRPGESEGPPGAQRFQVREDLWKGVVESMTPLCQVVIWTTGHSENLRWEIEHLVATAQPRRLLLWLHVWVGARSARERAEEWARFTRAYDDIFPKSLPAELGAARFIAFGADWTPIPIPGPTVRVSLRERMRLAPSVLGLKSYLDAQRRDRLRLTRSAPVAEQTL
jgi:hypothetical protein